MCDLYGASAKKRGKVTLKPEHLPLGRINMVACVG